MGGFKGGGVGGGHEGRGGCEGQGWANMRSTWYINSTCTSTGMEVP